MSATCRRVWQGGDWGESREERLRRDKPWSLGRPRDDMSEAEGRSTDGDVEESRGKGGCNERRRCAARVKCMPYSTVGQACRKEPVLLVRGLCRGH